VPFFIPNPLPLLSHVKTTRLNRIDVELLYTAPSVCPSKWAYTTTAFVDAPDQVTFAPTSVSTVFTQPQAFGPTSTKFIALVNPTDIPAGDLASLSSEYAPFFSGSCSIPYYYTATGTAPGSAATSNPEAGGSGGSSNSSSGDSGNDWLGCDPFVWYFGGIQMGQGYICDNGIYYVSSSPELGTPANNHQNKGISIQSKHTSPCANILLPLTALPRLRFDLDL
jgi:hypothetical protein